MESPRICFHYIPGNEPLSNGISGIPDLDDTMFESMFGFPPATGSATEIAALPFESGVPEDYLMSGDDASMSVEQLFGSMLSASEFAAFDPVKQAEEDARLAAHMAALDLAAETAARIVALDMQNPDHGYDYDYDDDDNDSEDDLPTYHSETLEPVLTNAPSDTMPVPESLPALGPATRGLRPTRRVPSTPLVTPNTRRTSRRVSAPSPSTSRAATPTKAPSTPHRLSVKAASKVKVKATQPKTKARVKPVPVPVPAVPPTIESSKKSTLPPPPGSDGVPEGYWYLLRLGCKLSSKDKLACYSCGRITNFGDMTRHILLHNRAETRWNENHLCTGCPCGATAAKRAKEGHWSEQREGFMKEFMELPSVKKQQDQCDYADQNAVDVLNKALCAQFDLLLPGYNA
ncbi:hypothetical protein R3P38DRAFT_3386550 [Favolaschia claudopus]|uniref:BED-type domain-containing protein n=1 Tax=Favolaschia claudopus TaxID=2862362 RepID=A0AAW0DLP6_9AGAR